jgi:hypothetical protein
VKTAVSAARGLRAKWAIEFSDFDIFQNRLRALEAHDICGRWITSDATNEIAAMFDASCCIQAVCDMSANVIQSRFF